MHEKIVYRNTILLCPVGNHGCCEIARQTSKNNDSRIIYYNNINEQRRIFPEDRLRVTYNIICTAAAVAYVVQVQYYNVVFSTFRVYYVCKHKSEPALCFLYFFFIFSHTLSPRLTTRTLYAIFGGNGPGETAFAISAK